MRAHPVLSQRDTGKSTLEDQLHALIRLLKIDKAKAEWARKRKSARGHPQGTLGGGQEGGLRPCGL